MSKPLDYRPECRYCGNSWTYPNGTYYMDDRADYNCSTCGQTFTV